MATDLPQLVAGELRAFARPVTDIAAADDPALALSRFVRACGWSPPPVVDPAPLTTLATDLEAAFAALETGLVPGSLEEGLERVELIAGLIDSVRAIGQSVVSLTMPGSASPETAAAFGADAVSLLLFEWLKRKRPLIDAATVAALVEYVDVPASEDDALARAAGRVPRLRADLLPSFLSSPLEQVAQFFAPDGWDEPEGAVITNLMLRSTIGHLITAAGGRWMTDPGLLRRGDEIGQLGRKAFVKVPIAGAGASFGAELEFVSRADSTASGVSGPVLHVVPHTTFSTSVETRGWSIDYGASLLVGESEPAPLPALTIGPDGVEATPDLTALVDLQARRRIDVVVGSGRTGLTLGEARFEIFGAIEDGAADFGFALVAADSSVGISTADFGAAVSSIVSFDASVPFDLGVEWSRDLGLRLTGAASLELLLSPGLDLGVVALSDVTLAFDPSDQLELSVTTDAAIAIAPVSMQLRGLGLAITLTPAEPDIAIELVSPTGLSIALESEVVTGGGFLEIDAEAGRYAGGLVLEVLGYGIAATVIVDTEIPGDAGGWALFGSVGLTIPAPIPLGFGFTLVGVGGLLALNRTTDVDALAGGLRTGAADAILFPEDIEEDADAVLAGLDQWFPLQDSTTVVGPVVKIGWGTPTLITGELGVLITLPDLIIALLGSVEMLLPTPDDPLLSLRMDVLGAVDVPASTVIVAASLHDSNLLGIYELSGDMGFYARTSEQPLFVLSIGGYHPQFDPPGAVPEWLLDLRRTTAAVDLGETVEVVLTSYVAVTSNTLQFGGRFQLEASVEVLLTTYTASGWFGVNVLLVLKPFKIVSRATAGVSISAGDQELFGVSLSARLEGPRPWYASGRATFTFFGFDVDLSFEVGSQPGGEPREVYDVAADVVAALSLAAAWESADLAGSWGSGVVMSDELPEGLWVRPDQLVEVRESIAPLNRTMTAYGEFVPAGDRIDATNVTLGAETVADPEWLDDWFAPAQFDRLGDTARLSSPSYELMTAGVRFGDDGIAISADPDAECTSVDRAPEESVYVSAPRPVATAPLVRTVAGVPITVVPTSYTLVGTADGVPDEAVLAGHPPGAPLSYAEAEAILSSQEPAIQAGLRIAPSHAAMEAVAV